MNKQTIVLGGGCFWCLEAVYNKVSGVELVTSGYAGGTDNERVNYYRVATGVTGHAEVVQIEFDVDVVPLETLLDVFWVIHDPTMLNRQGADAGTEYRSIILYASEEQKNIIEASVEREQAKLEKKIVTEVAALDTFHKAEISHQDYYAQNKNYNPYCQLVIDPKLQKFMKHFGELAKE